MQFVVMGLGFEVVDYVLPVGCEDVFVGSVKTLVDLVSVSFLCPPCANGDDHTFAQAPV